MSHDFETYSDICQRLELPYSASDEIEAGNHKIMLELAKRLIKLEKKLSEILLRNNNT